MQHLRVAETHRLRCCDSRVPQLLRFFRRACRSKRERLIFLCARQGRRLRHFACVLLASFGIPNRNRVHFADETRRLIQLRDCILARRSESHRDSVVAAPAVTQNLSSFATLIAASDTVTPGSDGMAPDRGNACLRPSSLLRTRDACIAFSFWQGSMCHRFHSAAKSFVRFSTSHCCISHFSPTWPCVTWCRESASRYDRPYSSTAL